MLALKIAGILVGAFLVMGLLIIEPAKQMPEGPSTIYIVVMLLLLVAATAWWVARVIKSRAGHPRG